MAVYFIRAGADGPVKIGFATNPTSRIIVVQTGTPEKLTVLRVMDGCRAFEAALHRHFAHLRTRGEWFAYSDEMLGDLAFLQPIASAGSDQAMGVSKIIDLLGGPTSVARAMGLPTNTVGNWKGRGSILSRYHDDLIQISGGCVTADMLSKAHRRRNSAEPAPPPVPSEAA